MADPFDRLARTRPAHRSRSRLHARLRARLARALVLPKGVTVSELTVDRLRAPLQPGGVDRHAGSCHLTPYLAVSGAYEALDWYGEALGARLASDPIVMPDGRIGHAELDIAGAQLMLSEEYPEIGVVAPGPGGGATVTIHLSVEDVDEVIGRAVAVGATLERAAADYDYGRKRRDPRPLRPPLDDLRRPQPAGRTRRPPARRHRLRLALGARRGPGRPVLRQRARLGYEGSGRTGGDGSSVTDCITDCGAESTSRPCSAASPSRMSSRGRPDPGCGRYRRPSPRRSPMAGWPRPPIRRAPLRRLHASGGHVGWAADGAARTSAGTVLRRSRLCDHGGHRLGRMRGISTRTSSAGWRRPASGRRAGASTGSRPWWASPAVGPRPGAFPCTRWTTSMPPSPGCAPPVGPPASRATALRHHLRGR